VQAKEDEVAAWEVQRMTQNDGIPSNGGVHFLLLFNFVYEW